VINAERKPAGKAQKGRGPVDMSLPADQRGRKRAAPGSGTKSQGKRTSGLSDHAMDPRRLRAAREGQRELDRTRRSGDMKYCLTCYGSGTIVVKGEVRTCPACKGSGER
jgi:hypothetical protein